MTLNRGYLFISVFFTPLDVFVLYLSFTVSDLHLGPIGPENWRHGVSRYLPTHNRSAVLSPSPSFV